MQESLQGIVCQVIHLGFVDAKQCFGAHTGGFLPSAEPHTFMRNVKLLPRMKNTIVRTIGGHCVREWLS